MVWAEDAARHAGRRAGRHARRPHRPVPAARRRPTSRRRPLTVFFSTTTYSGQQDYPYHGGLVDGDGFFFQHSDVRAADTNTTRTEEASEAATEAAAAEQQATAKEQRPQSGRPTTRSWESEDVRFVQAEPAKHKHGRKGAGAEVEEAWAGRALPAPTTSTQHPRRRSRTGSTQRARA